MKFFEFGYLLLLQHQSKDQIGRVGEFVQVVVVDLLYLLLLRSFVEVEIGK